MAGAAVVDLVDDCNLNDLSLFSRSLVRRSRIPPISHS